MSRTVELAPGIMATVADDVSPATINALRCLASEARHRELHGYISGEPLEIRDDVNYESRAIGCAFCGARMPHAPWPTNSESSFHRPRCGKCGSSFTYPSVLACAAQLEVNGPKA